MQQAMAIVIVFVPLTLGVLLVLVPMLFERQSVTPSCRRCGLRLVGAGTLIKSMLVTARMILEQPVPTHDAGALQEASAHPP